VSNRAQAVPWSLHRAYFSPNKSVSEVPSRKEAGMRAEPCHDARPPVRGPLTGGSHW
jgi:hypothetical protein